MNTTGKAFVFSVACTCMASAGPLNGTWTNIDQNTRSIPKIIIASTPKDGTQFEFWGRTHPQDTKNGPFKLSLLGDSPSDKSPDKHAYARYDAGFAEKVFFMRTSGDQLIVECLTLFKANDKLSRSSYREREVFKRQQ